MPSVVVREVTQQKIIAVIAVLFSAVLFRANRNPIQCERQHILQPLIPLPDLQQPLLPFRPINNNSSAKHFNCFICLVLFSHSLVLSYTLGNNFYALLFPLLLLRLNQSQTSFTQIVCYEKRQRFTHTYTAPTFALSN